MKSGLLLQELRLLGIHWRSSVGLGTFTAGPAFNPWSGNWDPGSLVVQPKTKKKQQRNEKELRILIAALSCLHNRKVAWVFCSFVFRLEGKGFLPLSNLSPWAASSPSPPTPRFFWSVTVGERVSCQAVSTPASPGPLLLVSETMDEDRGSGLVCSWRLEAPTFRLPHAWAPWGSPFSSRAPHQEKRVLDESSDSH